MLSVVDSRNQHRALRVDAKSAADCRCPEDRDVTLDVYNRLFEQIPWHDANSDHAGSGMDYERTWFRLYGSVPRPPIRWSTSAAARAG